MKKKRKYIYLEKCLIIRILQIYIFSFYDFLFFISLSDAKMCEDVSEEFVCGDFAGDGAEGVIGLPEVFGEQVVRDSGRHRRFEMKEVFFCIGEGGKMPQIRHDRIVRIESFVFLGL